jgi:hypothetical protein
MNNLIKIFNLKINKVGNYKIVQDLHNKLQ